MISNKGLYIRHMLKSHVILYNSHPLWYATWLSNFEFIFAHITKLFFRVFFYFSLRLPDTIGVYLSETRAPSRVMAPQVKTWVPTRFLPKSTSRSTLLRRSRVKRESRWPTGMENFQRWRKCNTGKV